MQTVSERTFSRTALVASFLVAASFGTRAVAQVDCPVQPNDDGVIVLFAESVPPEGAWSEETSNVGFTGTSYYRWSGPNHFNNPGNGTIEYRFEVFESANYQLRIYNYHDDPDSTMENDCWLRMDGQGEWMKTYSNGADTVADWNWKSRFDVDGPDPNANYDLDAGEHVLEVSGRSNDFCIDRIHLYMGGNSDGINLNLPAGECDDSTDGNYCTSALNSSGYGAGISWEGTTSISADDLILITRPVPGEPGLFFYGRSATEVPFGDGFLCVEAPIYRLGIAQATNGTLTWVVKQNQLPSAGTIAAGETMYFQTWYRDTAAGASGWNMSDGLSLTFTP